MSVAGKKIIGDTECPKCKEMGRDKTGNHLILFEDDAGAKWGSCNRCGYYEADEAVLASVPTHTKVELTPEQLKEVLDDIKDCPIQALTTRKVNRDVAERFQVRVGLSYKDGTTVTSHFYPKEKNGVITAYKVRSLDPKGFYAAGNGSGCDFFGMTQASRSDVFKHTLYVFEDELSAMSGYQVLRANSKPEWAKFHPACVSLPDGTKVAARTFAQNASFINLFKEIVVCMDNDEAGNGAASLIRKLHPSAKIVRLPMKDANDLLMAGRDRDLYSALRFEAKIETPDYAVGIAESLDEALKKPEWGLSYPWEGFTKLTYGIRPGELIAIGAGTSIGKSLIAHELAAHLAMVEGQRIGMFMLEETVGNTIKNVAGKLAKIPFHRPDVEYDPKVLRDAAMQLDGKVFLWHNFGQNNWDNIKQCIRYWVVTEGCKHIVLDNITTMVSHLSTTEINAEIGRISTELTGMCHELGFTCFIFSHLNAPSGGKTHEEGAEVKEAQFTGSRMLMR